MIFPNPKPGKRKRGVGQKKSGASRMYRDGRVVLSEHGWRILKQWMWKWIPRVCHLCGEEILDYTHFEPDHIIPRGLGGGTRDDRFVKPSHSWCNREKGSRRDFGFEHKEKR